MSTHPRASPLAAAVFVLAAAAAQAGPLLGAYKDVSLGIDTAAPRIAEPAWSAPPRRGEVLIWAFATGECGRERWGDFDTQAFARLNVAAHEAAGRDYIVSTGGAVGAFTCEDDAAMLRFVERYVGRDCAASTSTSRARRRRSRSTPWCSAQRGCTSAGLACA